MISFQAFSDELQKISAAKWREAYQAGGELKEIMERGVRSGMGGPLELSRAAHMGDLRPGKRLKWESPPSAATRTPASEAVKEHKWQSLVRKGQERGLREALY